MRTTKRKAHQKTRSHRRTSRTAKTSRSSSTAIIKPINAPIIVQQGKRERELRPEEVALLKRTVAKNTDNDQFALFLWVCRKHRVDPLTKEVFCILYKNKDTGGYDMSIQMGVNGYRNLAARNHPKDFGSIDEPKWEMSDAKTEYKKTIPTSASVSVWKKGADRPTTATCFWEEFAPRDLTAGGGFWARMPKHMLAKCAESHALRKAYPDMADIYTTEEMAQKNQDFTEGGRQITDQAGFAPSGQPVTREAKGQIAVEAEVERQKAAHKKPDPSPQKSAAAPAKAAPARTAAKPAPAVEVEHPADTRKVIEWDWGGSDGYGEDGPILRGDLSEAIEALQKYCPTMVWKGDWWHIAPKDYNTVVAFCQHVNFRLKEVEAKVRPKPTGSKPAEKKSSGRKAAAPHVEPRLLKGRIERVTSGMTSGNVPTRQVKIGGEWHTCYRNTLFDFLDRGNGKEAELWIDVRQTIVGLKRVGTTEFDSDGKTPVVQKDREPGRTLFNG